MDSNTEDLEYLIQILIDEHKTESKNVEDGLSDIKNYLKQIETNTVNASKLVLQSPPQDLNASIEYKDLSNTISILVSRLDELNILLNRDISNNNLDMNINIDIETKINKDILKNDLNSILNDLNTTIEIIPTINKDVLNNSLNNTTIDIIPNVNIDFLKAELDRLINLPDIKMDIRLNPIYEDVDKLLKQLDSNIDVSINPKLNIVDDIQKEIDNLDLKSILKIDTMLDSSNIQKSIDTIISELKSNIILDIDIDTEFKDTNVKLDVVYKPNPELDNIISKLSELKNVDIDAKLNIISNIDDIKKSLSYINDVKIDIIPDIKIPILDLKPIDIKGVIKPIILDPDFKTDDINIDLKSKPVMLDFNIDQKSVIKSIESILTDHKFKINIDDTSLNLKTIDKIEKKESVSTSAPLNLTPSSDNLDSKEILKVLETNNKLLMDLINLQKVSKKEEGRERELINNTKETIISTNKETINNNNKSEDDTDIKSILSDILYANQDMVSTMKRNSFKNNSDILL